MGKFQPSYYGEKRDKPLINVREFKENYPMHIIDCSRQNKTKKNSIVDIRIDFQSSTNIATNTASYALILHDKLLHNTNEWYSGKSNIIPML